MRIVLTSFGSWGDIQPLLALATTLRRRGHSAILALPPEYEAQTRDVGGGFYALGRNLTSAALHDFDEEAVEAEPMVRQAARFASLAASAAEQAYPSLTRLCESADVLVSSPFQPAGRMVFDRLGLPFVSLHLAPVPLSGARDIPEATAPLVNACRVKQGLSPLVDPLGADAVSPLLALFAVSRCVMRESPQWRPHWKLTGFFYRDQDWTPGPELRSFLDDGEAPVVISLGSTMLRDPQRCTRVLIGAVQRAGCRAIVQRGWAGLGDGNVPDTVRVVGYVPHQQLFTCACAVVHHGGAGTTAAAWRAGAPCVVILAGADRPLWAAFAQALGCCGGVIPLKDMTEAGLAEALVRTRDVASYRVRAKAVADFIAKEGGVAAACDEIEHMMAGRGATFYPTAR